MDEWHATNATDAASARNAASATNAMTTADPTTTAGAASATGASTTAGALSTVDTVGAVLGASRRQHTAYVTPEGAAWLASASVFPRSVAALWQARPTAPSVLPCGTAFDVVNLPALFGRRVLERLWSAGPGSGPAAVHRGRVLLLSAPGTARRLPALLEWEQWRDRVPPLLCHGAGDAVTVPPLYGPPRGGRAGGGVSRWLVAPATRTPWLPGADTLLRACVRAARGGAAEPGGTVPALFSAPGTA